MKINARRTAGEPLALDQCHELEALAALPDEEIDFSDIPERLHHPSIESGQTGLTLEEHTVTVHVDAEVAAWLKAAAKEDAEQINLLLRHLARKALRIRESTLVRKAS